jgi:hypothetical protein
LVIFGATARRKKVGPLGAKDMVKLGRADFFDERENGTVSSYIGNGRQNQDNEY